MHVVFAEISGQKNKAGGSMDKVNIVLIIIAAIAMIVGIIFYGTDYSLEIASPAFLIAAIASGAHAWRYFKHKEK